MRSLRYTSFALIVLALAARAHAQQGEYKTITLTEAEYNNRVREARLRCNGTDLLTGNQSGRVQTLIMGYLEQHSDA